MLASDGRRRSMMVLVGFVVVLLGGFRHRCCGHIFVVLFVCVSLHRPVAVIATFMHGGVEGRRKKVGIFSGGRVIFTPCHVVLSIPGRKICSWKGREDGVSHVALLKNLLSRAHGWKNGKSSIGSVRTLRSSMLLTKRSH
jgi:hypothetical protein